MFDSIKDKVVEKSRELKSKFDTGYETSLFNYSTNAVKSFGSCKSTTNGKKFMLQYCTDSDGVLLSIGTTTI